jgi:hypothetical protein
MPRKTRPQHRNCTDRKTAVEFEQRDRGNGEESYRCRFSERNSAEEYFDKKERNKAREAVIQERR